MTEKPTKSRWIKDAIERLGLDCSVADVVKAVQKEHPGDDGKVSEPLVYKVKSEVRNPKPMLLESEISLEDLRTAKDFLTKVGWSPATAIRVFAGLEALGASKS